ncbi:hypothetical protein ALC57_08365, partial [Trachymyrmex cornetzi]
NVEELRKICKSGTEKMRKRCKRVAETVREKAARNLVERSMGRISNFGTWLQGVKSEMKLRVQLKEVSQITEHWSEGEEKLDSISGE